MVFPAFFGLLTVIAALCWMMIKIRSKQGELRKKYYRVLVGLGGPAYLLMLWAGYSLPRGDGIQWVAVFMLTLIAAACFVFTAYNAIPNTTLTQREFVLSTIFGMALYLALLLALPQILGI